MESEVMSAGRSTTPEPLKQERGSTPSEGGRKSPPPNCAICLGCCQNKSFTDSCLHQFCFNCLLTWSKIKAECPLCKQTFKSIIHNVRSNHQYEEYMVEQRQAEVVALPIEDLPDIAPRRFRYRTTITFPRSERNAIQRLLVGHVESAPPPRPDAFPPRRPFRQTVYRHNLFARPLPDFTGRLRDCTPEFFRANEAQKYRLVPWLTRELDYLLEANHSHIAYVMARILDLLPVHAINSSEFMVAMLPFFGERTEHFLYELMCFASTPYDMLGYDRNVQYGPDPRINTRQFNDFVLSTDTDSDSDIVEVRNTQPEVSNVIPIETISHSESEDSSSEVIMTGYIKPPQDRTPEIVDLLASDSDVLIQDESPPPSTSRDVPSASALVKLTLSRKMRPPDTDSDEDYVPETRKRTRSRNYSQDSASTTSTHRTTPSQCSSSNELSLTVSPPRIWESDCSGYTPPPLDIQRVLRSKREEMKRRKKKKSSHSLTSREHVDKSKKIKKPKVKKHKKKRDTSRSRISNQDRAGTSGTQRSERSDRKRLRSVVCTPPLNNCSNKLPNGDSDKRVQSERSSGSSSKSESSRSREEGTSFESSTTYRLSRKRKFPSSDSDDDIPLNLTVNK